MRRRSLSSISLPIILSSIAVALSVALLVGWIYVVLRNLSLTKQYAENIWLLVVGIISFVVVLTVLVLSSVFLAREIREVRRQTGFIDSVTHELRSPLASLRLCLETLARRELGTEQRERLRDMMLGDVERLSGFVDDILSANRLGHGEGPQPISEVTVAEVVRGCVVAVSRRLRIEEGVVEVDVPADLQLVTDPVALQLVVRNLVDNAVKYSEPPHWVRVEARARGQGSVRLAVHDRGVGIAKRDLKRIFDRFYRAPDETVRARRGVGLGLFVAAALVRNLGGKIRAHSEGLGRGATMEVTLPSLSRHRARALKLESADHGVQG